ncbi:amino acid ABC transporter permease [Zongyangia hominis]|uniref:Amino acid ABC transporter permease n=1 Tax=Zongyangia hominis TaxID=2763677 RepID=A0A926EDC5_9FIRM|nr:amino acid ABC transporter permease [Zongyangia hominis]MBC8570051.1 amino acid ABC transporter permease [Zongyangia hominis]
MVPGLANIFTSMGDYLYEGLIEQDRWLLLLKGLGNTVIIALFATLIGVVIGILVAVAKVAASQNRKLRWLGMLCDLYLTVIRGTPIVVQLLIMYFSLFAFITNAIPVAIITFGINSGAYVAEIVRSGIMAVDKGQTEAGRSLGLTQSMTMRYIVMPQAIKNILPALGNEFIALLKETSVAGYIALMDITSASNLIRGRTYNNAPLYVTALTYLVLVIGMTKALGYFERRMAKNDQR